MKVKSAQGLTLIELVIVLALMVILSHTALISLALVDRQNLNQACMQLKADLRYAQRLAIMENRRYRVDFDVKRNKYVILYKENSDDIFVKTVEMSGGVRLVSTSNLYNSVTYTSMGTTGDPCTITLRNDTYMAQLTVNLGVGRVKLTSFKKI